MPRLDDPNISGEMILYRRIPPWGGRVDWESDGHPPSSQNFRDADEEMSVFIADEVTEGEALEGNEGFGLVSFKAGKVRELFGPAIIMCRDEPPPGHVLICGNITNGMARKLRNAAQWVPNRLPTRLPPDAVPPTA